MTLLSDRPIQLGRHLILAVALGLVAPFTGLAWPFALATGIVIGKDEVEKSQGVPESTASRIRRRAAVTGGILAMLIAGAVIGGLIAIVIVRLSTFSERLAADASAIDRSLARIVLFIAAGAGWLIIGSLLDIHLDLRFGS